MAKKRGQNEGSIRKRADGIWEARVTVGILANGKQNRKSIYGKTRQEVAAKMTDLLNNLQKGIITNPTEMTLGEWLDCYMPEYKKRFVKNTTYINYTVKVENHIKPAIGQYKLKALRQEIIQKFINSLSDKGLAPATIEAIYKLLHNALEIAVDNGLIVRNVSQRVKLPKVVKPKINVLTLEQQRLFIEKAKEVYMGNVYIFALCTGMRLGELLGLKWNDIDFDNKELYVKRTLSIVKDMENEDEKWHIAFGSPKTPASERMIPLSHTALRLLLDVKEQQNKNKTLLGNAYEDNDFVFSTKLGKPLDPRNMRRTFYRICNLANIEGMHPHCLRHTFATRGAENMIDVRVMQQLLGHSSIKETADTYTHVLGGLKKSEINKLDKVVSY